MIGDWSDAFARVIVCSLFFGLASRFLNDFQATGRITDLLLVIGEVLVVVLTCLRRPATVVDRRPMVRFVTAVSMLAPLMLRPSHDVAIIPEAYAAVFVGLKMFDLAMTDVNAGLEIAPHSETLRKSREVVIQHDKAARRERWRKPNKA